MKMAASARPPIIEPDPYNNNFPLGYNQPPYYPYSILPVKRLDTDAKLPQKSDSSDAGFDLSSIEILSIPPQGYAKVKTGLAVEIPEGYAGYIQPRSGLAAKQGISIVNSPGLIDSGYRGELQIILINHGKETFFIEKGDRIAQLVILQVPEFVVQEVDTLNDSLRGEQGFGSSGV
jgi:dUTP pyrophosphatase